MRLRTVLSRRDFPAPELRALVLDGEAYTVDECVLSIDQESAPEHRAAALALQLGPRLIAEQHSAAWVWGAVSFPPARHEVCSDISARVRPPLDSPLAVREVIILPEDVAWLAGVTLTTPMRTAIDLARFVAEWTPDEERTVTALLALAGCTVLDCARVMNRKRNLPGKKLALERLAGCLR